MKKLTLCLLILIGLAIGFATQQATVPPREEVTQASIAARSQNLPKNSSRQPLPEIEELSRALQFQPGPEPILRWIAKLENTPLKDLPRFAISLSPPFFITGMHENRIEDELFTKYWVELAPENLFQHSVLLTKESAENLGYSDATGYSRAAVQELVKRDPEAAVALLEEDNQYPLQNRLREVVINELMKHDPERALEYTIKWKTWYLRPDTGKAFQNWVKKNPTRAATLILSEPALATSADVLTQTAKVWGRKNPEGALQLAINSDSPYASKFRDEAFRTWAKKDLAAAGRWLAEVEDPTVAGDLTLVLVESWGKKSPTEAITWSQANLQGTQLSKVISSFLPAVIMKSPHSIPELLDAFTDPAARSLAELAAAETYFNDFRTQDIKRPPFPAGKDWIEQIEDPDTLGKVLYEATQYWSKEDPESLLTLLNDRIGDSFNTQTYESIASQLVSAAPAETFDWISRIPSQHRPEATSHAFYSWMSQEPQAANEWFSELPSSDPKAKHAFDFVADQITFWPQQKIEAVLKPLSSQSRQALKESLKRAEANGPDREKARAFVLETIDL